MPTYDYVCGGCGAPFEAFVRTARARPPCPACKARRATRLPALVAVRGGSRDAPALPTHGKPAQGCGLIERPGECGHDHDAGSGVGHDPGHDGK